MSSITVDVIPPAPVTVEVTPLPSVTVNVTPPAPVTVEVTPPAPVTVEVTPPAPIVVDVAARGVPGAQGASLSEVVVSTTQPVVTNNTLWIEEDAAGDVQGLWIVTP